ncbi:MAG: RDD family protein [Aureispira sp.]|nr:RDD family protein [Aureispira sp.]
MTISVYHPNYASVFKRLQAMVIDIVLVGLITFMLIEFGNGWHRNIPIISDFLGQLFYDPEPAQQVFIFILLFLAYDASLSSSPLQGSIGKVNSKIRIVDLDHLQISVFKAFFRIVLKLIVLIPAFYLLAEWPQTLTNSVYLTVAWFLFLGLFWLYSTRFQFPYDFFAQTIVVPK